MKLPKLTDLERTVLAGIYASEYHDGGERPWIWSWGIRANGLDSRSIPGVVSSLSRKGVVDCSGKGQESSIYVTNLGVEVARAEGVLK